MNRDDDNQEPESAVTEELSRSARDRARGETGGAGQDWAPPARIDEYELVKALGSGGMGRVYEYWDTTLARPVAIKFVNEPGRRRAARLHDEGRAAARFKHPNVAAVHRAGDVDGVPFIVSEYIDGNSLDRMTPLRPWRRALEVAMDLARGLAEAHRHGMVHGDIKPANAMLDARGVAKLIDFGLARRTAGAPEPERASSGPRADPPGDRTWTGKDRAYGTPWYMAPELEHGGGMTERSDVYAFGVMLYELCTDRIPRSGEDALADLDSGLATIVRRCMARDPEQRYASAQPLLEALEKLDRPVAIPAGNPYRWLRPFEAEHRALFFGRSAEIWEVLERLRTEHLVILAGGSGVGKSSLARAGVLPAVAEDGLDDGRAWQTCTVLPGRRPLLSLCQTLAVHLGAAESELVAELRARDFLALRRRVRELHGQTSGTVLFVDQLEELVILAGAEEAAIAGEALASLLVERTPGLRVLATARLDHVARLAHIPGLGMLVQGGVHIVGPLGQDAVRDTIVEPARAAGVEFESDALVDDLARTTAQAEGALPLLQFTLARLWEQRGKSGKEDDVITRKTLAEIGGVEGALAQHADWVMQKLLPANRTAARVLLLRMVTLDGTRARVSRGELEDGEGPRHTALEALIQGRLVVTGEAEGEPVCEIAHEALVSAWSRLKEWLEEEKGTRAVVTRISRAAAEWASMGRGRDGLWGPRHLRDVQSVELGELSGLERAFLAASRRAVARSRWLRRLALAAPVVVAAAVYGVVSYAQARELDRKVMREVTVAQSSLAQARAGLDAFREARDLAIAELGQGEGATGPITRAARERAERAWTSALEHEHEAELAYRNASTSLERAIGLDPGRASTRALVAQALDERAVFASERYLLDEQAEMVERLESYDAELHASWARPIVVQVDTEPSGAEVEIQPAPGAATPRPGAPERLRAPFDVALAPGSYVLIVKEDREHVEVRYPIYLQPRSSALGVEIARPAKTDPAATRGLVHVPEGRFLFGYGGGRASEHLRSFFETVPVHERRTGAFWIARHETTYAEWIEFLQACRAGRCEGIVPALPAPSEDDLGIRIELVPAAEGEWELKFQPEPLAEASRVGYGDTLVYTKREGAAREQDWRNLPVTGLTQGDIQAYLDWLAGPDNPRGLPGTRLCREDEWERAARGADARMFPHGDTLGSREANIDVTYGRKLGAYGPDMVGSHGESESPFGLHDMSGNVWEMTMSMFEESNPVHVRSGSYFQNHFTAAVVNRWVITREQKDSRTGFRVCASAEVR
jgi:eukaryotic-like serine/threonine-protein kinase